MPKPDPYAIDEVIKYLEDYDLSAASKNSKLHADIYSVNKRIMPLLIWQYDISETPVWPKSPRKSSDFSDYLTECISDLCQSILLISQGLYKPANLILRCCAENIFKMLAIYDDKGGKIPTSVYELIELIKQTTPIQSTPNARSAFIEIKACYRDLCKHVHSASKAHMSLNTTLNNFPNYSQGKSHGYVQQATNICLNLNILLCFLLKDRFFALHHTQRDQILSQIPRPVRKIYMS